MSSFRLRRRPGLQAGGLLLVLLLAGCGESHKPLFPVQGQVLDPDGKPAAGAKVVFHPVGGADAKTARPVGVVNEAGAFSLTTYTKGDGAPAGDYIVTIEWRAQRTSPFGGVPGDQLGGKYARPDKSPYKATVGNQATTLEPFRLSQES
jgi:hypothetical protein